MSKLLLPQVLLFASLTCFGSPYTPEQIKEYHQYAEEGLIWYQNNLGYMYDNGDGVPRMTQKPLSGIAKPLSRGAMWRNAT